jgi:hypothetical protein
LLGNNSVFQLLELLINEPKDFISRWTNIKFR